MTLFKTIKLNNPWFSLRFAAPVFQNQKANEPSRFAPTPFGPPHLEAAFRNHWTIGPLGTWCPFNGGKKKATKAKKEHIEMY